MVDKKVRPDLGALAPSDLKALVFPGEQTKDPEEVGPKSERMGFLHRLGWKSLSLATQFLLIALLIVCGSMALLGHWLSDRIYKELIRSRAETGGLYMEGFLAPHVQELSDGVTLRAESHQELDRLLIDNYLPRRIASVRIWLRDGTVVYSTDKDYVDRKLPSSDIAEAFTGKIVSQLEWEADDEDTGGNHRAPLLEIYAPIYRQGTREILAVGEFYELADRFLNDIIVSRNTTWGIVGATTGAIVLLLFLVVRRSSVLIASQRVLLHQQLADARALADQNRKLHQEAVRDKAGGEHIK